MPERILTLDDTVKLAIHNSPSLLMLQEDEQIALQRVHQAEGLWFPKLDLNANWSKFRVQGDNPMLLQPALGPTIISNSPAENYYTARADIFQTVYEGGRTRNIWRQARVSYERAKTANEVVRTQVEGSAKEAFYSLLLAQENRKLYQEALKRLARVSPAAPKPTLEGLRLEREMAELRDEASRARRLETETRLAYLHALNLELNTNVYLKGELTTQRTEMDLQKMLAWASQYRAELRQTEYQEELDALGVSLSLAERYPTVGFGASYERVGNNINLDNAANWAGTFNVNIPLSISDFVFGWTKVRERKAQYRQATLKHAETSDQIQLQVRQAYNRVQFWQEELGPRELDWQRVEKLRALMTQQGEAREHVEVERLVLESRLRFNEAVYGHLQALCAMERAVGHSLQ